MTKQVTVGAVLGNKPHDKESKQKVPSWAQCYFWDNTSTLYRKMRELLGFKEGKKQYGGLEVSLKHQKA